MTFESLGIPVGSELVFTRDSSVTVKTVDTTSKVMYNGQVMTLSGVAVSLIGRSARGAKYFKYNGIRLETMYNNMVRDGVH